ncbi:hypothetical protein LguiA_013022 [Lonicera macranthoides]
MEEDEKNDDDSHGGGARKGEMMLMRGERIGFDVCGDGLDLVEPMVELDSEKPEVESLQLTYTRGDAIKVVVQVPRFKGGSMVDYSIGLGGAGPVLVQGGLGSSPGPIQRIGVGLFVFLTRPKPTASRKPRFRTQVRQTRLWVKNPLSWLGKTIQDRVIGKYKDDVLCDVGPMQAGHMILGRQWQLDRQVNYNGIFNKYSFKMNERTVTLVPLPPKQAHEYHMKL